MTNPEKRYRILFDSIQDGVVRTTPDGIIVEANPAFVKMLGYEDDRQVLGPFQKHTPTHWHAIEERIIMGQLAEYGHTDEYEKEYVRKDGRLLPVSVKLWKVSMPGNQPEVWGLIRDISQQKKAQRMYDASLKRLKSLNHHKVEAREKERKTIASYIHDEIGQAMTALKLEIEFLRQDTRCAPACHDKLDSIIMATKEVINKTQHISAELRPGILDSLGLKAATEWYCQQWQQKTGINVNLSTDDFFITPKAELALFRVLQEALTNVSRHARATSVDVELGFNKKHIRLSIIDNGVGIPQNKISNHKSYGLIGMRERAEMCNGELDIWKGSGTHVVLTIPVKAQ